KPEDFEVDDSGNVDETEIADAIEDLLKRKPYLGAKNRPRFQGTGDGGSQRQPAGPSQLTKDDLKGMTPEAIVKAKAEGRLKNLLSGKSACALLSGRRKHLVKGGACGCRFFHP